MPDDLSEGYKIAQVERITGVGVHTLRAWERRYGVPEPDRSGGRQRMYSLADIELINRMRRLSEQGVPLTRAAELARREMAERGGRTLSDGLVGRLFTALMSWDEAAASSAWMDALETFDIQTTFDRVVVPLLRDVGNAWHDGTVSVAQEHFASNFVRARLDLLSRQVTPVAGAPLVLLACMEGEHHELGLLMLAVMVRFSGLRTIYLGQDVPDDALLRTAEDAQPNVLAVNAGTTAGAQRLLPLLPRIRAAAPLTEVVYGGGGFDSDATARQLEGASYGGADLGSAVLLINQLGRRARTGGKS
jgi:methanogenic corrinoid protein MtbC1